MPRYQTGSLTSEQCEMIAEALDFMSEALPTKADQERCYELRDLFKEPEKNLIRLPDD